jgi:hypothetical protein
MEKKKHPFDPEMMEKRRAEDRQTTFKASQNPVKVVIKKNAENRKEKCRSI